MRLHVVRSILQDTVTAITSSRVFQRRKTVLGIASNKIRSVSQESFNPGGKTDDYVAGYTSIDA